MSVGGSASNNGVEFVSDNYSAKFVMGKDTDNYVISTKKLLQIKRAKRIIKKIPILRGLYTLLSSDKIIASAIAVVIFIDFFPLENLHKGNETVFTIIMIVLNIIMWANFAYVFKTIIFRIKSTWAYHGAEHKTIYAYDSDMELTLENVRGCPRISKRCGTNLIVFLVVFFVILNFFIGYHSIRFLASFALAYELFDLEKGDKMPIIRIFFKLGYFCQQKLFTREPSDIQLTASIDTLNKLIELECETEVDAVPVQ